MLRSHNPLLAKSSKTLSSMYNQGSTSGHYLFFVGGLYIHGSNRIVQFGFNLGLDSLFKVSLNKAHFTQVVQAKVKPKWINLVG